MSDDPHIYYLLGVVALSIAFPIFVCFHRKLHFASWAKLASTIACIFGLGWGYYDFKVTYIFVADMNYDLCRDYGLKGLFGGICIGLVFSILVAKPYVKRVD
jgi:hypothetical protein